MSPVYSSLGIWLFYPGSINGPLTDHLDFLHHVNLISPLSEPNALNSYFFDAAFYNKLGSL